MPCTRKQSRLATEIERARITVWFDRELIPGQRYREIIAQPIEDAKAVVVLWTANSVSSDWVIDEAHRAGKKLICLRDPVLDIKGIPAPFSSNVHIAQLGKHGELMAALRRPGAEGQV